MEDINTTSLSGEIAAPVEVKQTGTGWLHCRLRLAVINTRYQKGENGETTSAPFSTYFTVKAAGSVAEQCRGLVQGDRVAIVGKLIVDSWQDQYGNRKYDTLVEAKRIVGLSKANR